MSTWSRPLVIVDRFPLPAVTGGRQRMWNLLVAIDALGPADLVVIGDATDAGSALLGERLVGWSISFVPRWRRFESRQLARLHTVRSELPSTLANLDIDAMAAAVAVHATNREIVVAMQPVAIEVGRNLPGAHALVVDLWDVYHVTAERESAERDAATSRWSPRSVWRRRLSHRDVKAWLAWERAVAGSASLITLCSEPDRAALPADARSAVVPNGADVSPRPAVAPRDHAPTIVFHGQLAYGPNRAAAKWLVGEIVPLIRKSVPDVRVRLVGKAPDDVTALHDPPLVHVTGFVDQIEAEIDRAWVVVVPLRAGGGTRLKILEAFASGLPVVSTTLGVEGIEAIEGEHLSVADTAEALAAATSELLLDETLRVRRAESARRLVRSKYDWVGIRSYYSDLLSSLHSGDLLLAPPDAGQERPGDSDVSDRVPRPDDD